MNIRPSHPHHQQTRNPALAGTLADWSLVDVIQLLDLGKKTGAVVVHGHRDTVPVDGQIAFVEGAIHYAHNEQRDGIEAVFDLLSVTDGTFRFTQLDEVPPRNIYVSNEHVLMEGIVRQETLRPTAPPSDDERLVRLVAEPHPAPPQIVLTNEQWRVITCIRGEISINVLAKQLQYPPVRVRHILHDLIEIGLVAERATNDGRSPTNRNVAYLFVPDPNT